MLRTAVFSREVGALGALAVYNPLAPRLVNRDCVRPGAVGTATPPVVAVSAVGADWFIH